ncbi:Hpt domain-containing protein [Leptobacterium flavescens]|uniref:Hpt domain-containing protein n=1 Tax=Leptobacterium flavescens TaxID=472055 RepID=A0A6P0ULJ5_9FLAO|nr:Hpt domain-containing protein [Leptobacterium flavescens]NER12769.1 Hpt domain-containing protein [Leptobacterium flavescens]
MEQPNLLYIDDLAGNDSMFKQKLIQVIKEELPEEIKIYLENYDKGEFVKAAQNVHKLKHKISILGLTKGYAMANEFEHNLKNNIPPNNLHEEFKTLLEVMDDFIARQ